MDDEEILGHLLKIEAEAAALVNDAQAEADRRIAEGEKKNRAAYEERFHSETERLETELQNEKAKVKAEYQKELETYREKLANLKTDTGRFSMSLEAFLSASVEGPGGGGPDA